MRIGIYTGNWNPQYGGAYTIYATIIEGITKMQTGHTFYVFHHKSEIIPQDKETVKFIFLNPDSERHKTKENKPTIKGKIKTLIEKAFIFKKIYFELRQIQRKQDALQTTLEDFQAYYYRLSDYKNELNIRAEELGIDLMWFITSAYLPVTMPFIFTLWDLAQLNHPYFPELNYVGWTWERREDLYRSALRKAAFVVVGTKEGRRETAKLYSIPKDKIKIIPFPVRDIRSKSNDKNINLDLPFILYPALFWPHKNHICILYALKILKEQFNAKVSCVFTGADKGNESYIRSKVSELQLEDQVKFLGFVSEEVMNYLYEKALCLVFPAFTGPDNLPTVEALFHKCPVIASNIRGAKDQLKDAVLYFSPTDEYQLANKINLLLTDTELRNELIDKGYALSLKYSVGNYITEIHKIFDQFAPIRRCWDSSKQYKIPMNK